MLSPQLISVRVNNPSFIPGRNISSWTHGGLEKASESDTLFSFHQNQISQVKNPSNCIFTCCIHNKWNIYSFPITKFPRVEGQNTRGILTRVFFFGQTWRKSFLSSKPKLAFCVYHSWTRFPSGSKGSEKKIAQKLHNQKTKVSYLRKNYLCLRASDAWT